MSNTGEHKNMTVEKKQPFGVRLRPTVRAAGEKCAEDDGRTLGALMEKLLADHLKAKGYLPGGKPAGKGRR